MIWRYLALFFFLLSCTPPSDYTHCKITEVIDGDTVKLANGKMVRYLGIDTPEVRIRQGGTFSYDPQPFSLEAKNRNRDLVEGKYVKLEFDVEKTDKYGRLLAYCFVNDTFVNAQLIKEGIAVTYTKPPNVRYTKELVAALRQAQESKRGIWGTYKPIPSNEANNNINQIRTVYGTVISTAQSEKCIYLNFGRNHKTDFTVVIFRDAAQSFYAEGIDPASFYRNKRIAVTGKIRTYNGPEIIASIPAEIEILD